MMITALTVGMLLAFLALSTALGRNDPRTRRLRDVLSKGVVIIPAQPAELARFRADERRDWLNRQLSESTEGIFAFEVIEEPPEDFAPPLLRPRELDRTAAVAQAARLRWQLQDDSRLLLERVVDILVILTRAENGYASPEIRYSFLVKMEENPQTFPPIIVVETESGGIVERLQQFKSWLGVSVSWKRSEPVRSFGKCISGDGGFGVIGGRVYADGLEFWVTCDHVLSPKCASRIFPRAGLNGPDAALLRSKVSCFSECEKASSRVANPVPGTELEKWSQRKLPVYLERRLKRGREGIIRARVVAFVLDGEMQRFPHVEILPVQKTYLAGLLRWPIYTPYFSKPGDSGTWIHGRDADAWCGMIVGGDPYFVSSYAIEPEPLLDFFSLNLGIQNRGIHLSAERYTHADP